MNHQEQDIHLDNHLDEELLKLEEQLQEIAPSDMPDNILARMESAMLNWQIHLSEEEKIVPISQQNQQQFAAAASLPKTNSQFGKWSALGAAATITLFSLVGYLFNDSSANKAPVTAAVQKVAPLDGAPTVINPDKPALSNALGNFSNASFDGIVSDNRHSDRAYQVIRRYYLDKQVTTDENGNRKVEYKPAVERILIPVQVD